MHGKQSKQFTARVCRGDFKLWKHSTNWKSLTPYNRHHRNGKTGLQCTQVHLVQHKCGYIYYGSIILIMYMDQRKVMQLKTGCSTMDIWIVHKLSSEILYQAKKNGYQDMFTLAEFPVNEIFTSLNVYIWTTTLSIHVWMISLLMNCTERIGAKHWMLW